MKKFGKSAIHDKGFRFYLTIGMKIEIDNLIEDIEEIKKSIDILEKWKKEKSFYRASTTWRNTSVRGSDGKQALNLKEWKEMLKNRKHEYEILMNISERALKHCKENVDYDAYYEDPQRTHIFTESNQETNLEEEAQ